ncbi:TlpA family protein disulfide reductase [Deinococcus detaillensis]|uniref:TlpA family protein disulfide reductase n=1 Tax=Deinococcus detaillensis TaxID=2592048 RepID=A0A553UUC9_9DEIO|nr:TlpA family protein disulfide reductase [Deinococcus detaillensis]TSA83826.1 TlpA family protein disulfide reductase [Deinococcus detaillensis]
MRWPAPTEFVHLNAVPDPTEWTRPGLVQFFNLECPACVSRGIPFMRRLHAEFGNSVNLLAIHTSRGHRLYAREQVEPQLLRFARDYAKLPFPVALDLDGSVAEFWHTEGTPHWLAFAPGGELLRSVYGSQEGAQTRLAYLLGEWAPN